MNSYGFIFYVYNYSKIIFHFLLNILYLVFLNLLNIYNITMEDMHFLSYYHSEQVESFQEDIDLEDSYQDDID
jgi:hypothetical protein